jgi:hypothetical protein
VIDPLLRQFPGLSVGYTITSNATPDYNCIAWAAGNTDRWWWPAHDGFWPRRVIRQETLAAFVQAYETLGYEVCPDGSVEVGFEKIAIYADAGGHPTHAARQLQTGRWTSKLGESVDIEHLDADAVNGSLYGAPQRFMGRPRSRWRRFLRRLSRMIRRG